ncbi:MAG TPA: metallophosphoesterase family protein [Candidatus Thermoplasmatota archaeon]|nr:metallophosphoesterase family protein [Candidatus Thermoplasmatota archaeon]
MRTRLALLGLVLFAQTASAQAPSGPHGVHLGVDPSGEALVVQWFTREPAASRIEVTGSGAFEGGFEALPQGAGFVHTVPLEGLAPGEYEYTVPDAGTFPLRVPGPADTARVAFLGDQGVTDVSARTVDRLVAEAPEAVFHAGDVAYGEGNPIVWDQWFEMVEPVAASVPWMPALGNHETYFVAPTGAIGDFVEAFRTAPNPEVDAFRLRFALPANELWWSRDVGPVHVVALDTFYSVFAEGSAEAVWLAKDLLDHADAPWTIVFLHEPPYSSNSHRSSVVLRAALAPLLEAGGVDVLVSAHDHGYERTWPLLGDEGVVSTAEPYVAGNGVVYLVTGGGGESLYDDWEEPQPAWSAARASEHHVTVLDATREALLVRAVKPDGSLLDEFRLEKTAPRTGVPTATVDDATPGTGLPALLAAAAAVARVATRRR